MRSMKMTDASRAISAGSKGRAISPGRFFMEICEIRFEWGGVSKIENSIVAGRGCKPFICRKTQRGADAIQRGCTSVRKGAGTPSEGRFLDGKVIQISGLVQGVVGLVKFNNKLSETIG